MSEKTRHFELGPILTIISGKILCHRPSQTKEVLSHLIGKGVYDHQIARLRKKVTPIILEQLPRLVPVKEEITSIKKIGFDFWNDYITKLEGKIGKTISLVQLDDFVDVDENGNEIDPLEELNETFGKDKVIPITIK